MALFKYLHTIDNCPSPYGPLLSAVLAKTIAQVNKQVSDVKRQGLKRGEYSKHSPADKAVIGRYASEHGVAKAVWYFKEKNLKESTVRDWKKAYDKELKEKCKCVSPGQAVVVTTLPTKRCGRPPVLGERLDKYLQEMILSIRGHGIPIGTSIVMGIGRGIMLKHNRTGLKEFGCLVNLNKEWAKSILHQMGFNKRRANSKSKMLPCNF